MSKTVWTARTDSDFAAIGYNSKNLTKPPRKSGSHVTFTVGDSNVTVTDHRRELKPWLRHKIALEFIAVGIVTLILIFGVFQAVI